MELKTTLGNAEVAFRDILPDRVKGDDWQTLLPLDVIRVERNDQGFEDFKHKWESFLNSLDKLWNRLNAYAKHHVDDEELKQFVLGHLGNLNQKRTTDDLLVYLDKARNSSHHTLWRHIRPAVQNEIVSDAKGVKFDFSSNMLKVYSPKGGTMSEMVLFDEGAVLLKEVQVIEHNQKQIYYLPESHQDRMLYPIDRVLPQMVGKYGLEFYMKAFEIIEDRLSQ